VTLVDIIAEIKPYYTTVTDDVINDFYKPCISQSKIYYRGVGYFRSSVFKLMNEDLIRFCLNEGKMTILTSTDIDPGDHRAAMEGYNLQSFYKTIEEMLNEDELKKSTKLLCAMIATGHLEIKIAVVPKGGIYHDKVGFFEDEVGNIVSFHGSGNETYNALVGHKGNIETYNVIWNWDEGYSTHGMLWEKGLRKTIRGDFKERMRIIDLSEMDKNILEKYEISLNLEDYIDKKEDLDSLVPELREHQKIGLRKWEENNQLGILEHATGSGKTITALTAIDSQVKQGGSVILMVPSLALMEQWHDEISKYLPHLIVGKIGGGKNDIEMLNLMKRGDEGMILISTISSAKTSTKLDKIKRVINHKKTSILLVIDECHHIGSNGCEELCNQLRPSATLGLSATPERFGDLIGNKRIKKIAGTVVHKYNLRDALNDGYLTPYEYHIHTVNLTIDEQDKYDQLRTRINVIYHQWKKDKDNLQLKSQMEIMTFKSRSIIRGAENKIKKMSSIIEMNYDSSHHWLIYCDTIEMLKKAEEEIRDIGLQPKLYYSEMEEFQKAKTLQSFEINGGILLAIKCLDEGINISAISHGMVLSSTTNPREFIQRRGRMLRKAEGKNIAYIFDTFALPEEKSGGAHIGFINSEILRARDLTLDSENRTTNTEVIGRIIRKYGLDEDLNLEEEVVLID